MRLIKRIDSISKDIALRSPISIALLLAACGSLQLQSQKTHSILGSAGPYIALFWAEKMKGLGNRVESCSANIINECKKCQEMKKWLTIENIVIQSQWLELSGRAKLHLPDHS
jgi:hypothetical protein